MTETRLIRIGEFSTLTRLSVRMLRYYDANGVLSPAATDDFTGHRFYASSQVRDATLIRQLRDEDSERWSYGALAKVIGCSRELVAQVSKRR